MNSDLIIIGSGPGGYKAAEYAAKAGLQVVVVERKELGGTCLNRGCIPTKALARHAALFDDLHEADAFGVVDLHYRIDFSRIMARKQQVVDTLRQGVEFLMSQPGITMVYGEAAFKDAHTVSVAGAGEFTAPYIIIATGAKPKRLFPDCVTSDELLQTDHVPRRLCIIGAGVIGMEFASIFSSFGSEVTVVEYLDECLPMVDADVAKRLRTQLKRRGVTFHVGAAVKEVSAAGVRFERKGKELTVEADMVLAATGRAPEVDGLHLELAGVAVEKQGVVVDDDLRTSEPHIYAIGDVNGRCQLAHAATAQGLHAVRCILAALKGAESLPEIPRMAAQPVPAAVFTHPELAFVGRQAACKARVNYRANGKALALGEPDGLLDLYADADGRITGCTCLGTHAADLVQEVSALMGKGTTVAELRQMIHIHPTVSELLVDAANQLSAVCNTVS